MIYSALSFGVIHSALLPSLAVDQALIIINHSSTLAKNSPAVMYLKIRKKPGRKDSCLNLMIIPALVALKGFPERLLTTLA